MVSWLSVGVRRLSYSLFDVMKLREVVPWAKPMEKPELLNSMSFWGPILVMYSPMRRQADRSRLFFCDSSKHRRCR